MKIKKKELQKFTPRKSQLVKNAEKLNGKRDMRKKVVKSTSVGSDLKKRIVKRQQGGTASYINVEEPVLPYDNNGWIPVEDVFSDYNLPTQLNKTKEEPLPEAVKYTGTKEEISKDELEKRPIKQNAFINGLRPIISDTLRNRGIDTKWTDYLVAQAALESGWGKSESGKFNLSGIKGKGTTRSTKEYINGKMINTKDSFKDYKNYEDWANQYINLLTNKRYGKAWTLNESEFMPYIVKQGYATDPNYISKYNKVLNEVKKYEVGGKIQRFKDGKPVKEHPETKDVYEFYSKWLSNPEYAKRIDKHGFYKSKGKEVAKFRQRALDNTTVEKAYWDNNYYDYVDKIVLPTKWNWLTDNTPAHEVGHVMGSYSYKGPLAKAARLSDKEVKYIISQMKGYDPDIINKKEIDEQLGIYGTIDQNAYNKAVKLEKLYNNPSLMKKDSYYFNSPEEAKASLQSFRYWLYKNGIYDINSGKPFTKDLLNKAKQKGGLDAPAKRLLDTFEDDKLINLMNTLASNNVTNQSNILYTKLGGRLIKKRF